MRILLAASASYDPPKGGSTRSNLVWLRALAARGHACRVVCGGDTDRRRDIDGMDVESVAGTPRLAERIGPAVAEFEPDFVLVSSEDLSHSILREAYRAAPDRLVYLAHTPQWFPFGPEAWHADPAAAALLGDALAVVAIGEHMAGYIREHLGREAVVVPPALYGEPPWPSYENFSKRSALLINACTAKGLPIFLELARRHAEVQFLALKGWGTTQADEVALRALGNVEVLETVGSIDEVFARTSVLLAPSLWYEGFGLVATEAMLRGVPVLASNHGGLTEAAAVSRYRLPVRPIEVWTGKHDETGMPVGAVEEQPVEAWSAALEEVLGKEEIYARERTAQMAAAREFAGRLKAEDLETLLLGLQPRPLRVCLVHNSTYYPGKGGGDKSNRLLMEALAKRGHRVRVFTRLEEFGEVAEARQEDELSARGVLFGKWGEIGLRYELDGVEVRTVTQETNLRQALGGELAGFRPDVILSSTDDPAHLLYETALKYVEGRVVYLVRAPVALPFGPDASSESEERTARLREADAVVAVSEYVARYCRQHGELEAEYAPIALADSAAPPRVGSFDNPYVTLVNASAVKGLLILLGLADAMPEIRFAVVPGWGTTEADLAAIRERRNVTVLGTVDDITDILRQTRVTLVPSLWAEAWGRIVGESLSRGVPVLAAAIGGLPEAMMGLPYLLPVRPIERYRGVVGEGMTPEAEVPEQELGPWVETLRRLVNSREEWEELSERGRKTALEFQARTDVGLFEGVLRRVMVKRKLRQAVGGVSLSAVKRRLLSRRLEEYRAARRRRCFPVKWGEGVKVFLFPWAEGGVQAWSFLREERGLCWMPALLAGREDRRGEALPEMFGDWVKELADGVMEEVAEGEKFVLAGHSMGGGLAFEVARELRRRGGPQAAGLLVSSCTAPGAREVFDDGIEGDRALFRAHVYAVEDPLEMPLTAMSGEENIAMADWARETRREFRRVTMAGDHFWLRDAAAEWAGEVRRF